MLDAGRVVELGTHDDLLLAGGRYTTLASRDVDLGASPVRVVREPTDARVA